MTLDRDRLGSTIGLLAERWKSAGALLPVFPLLARGAPLPPADIARCTGVPEESVVNAVRAGRCERDAAGRITNLYGMTLSPTMHRVEIESRIVFSCCALWAHVIPQLVERVATIESVDPMGREVVRLRISPDGVESVDPPRAVATMAHPSREAVAANVGEAFCRHVRHFVSKETALQFTARAPDRQVVAISDLQASAGMLYRAIRDASQAR